jgi:hypothetical protein
MLRSKLRQVDLLEFVEKNSTLLASVRKERYRLEKGFVAYAKDASAFIRDMRRKDEKKDEKKDDVDIALKKRSEMNLAQYYQSQDLLKRMKWKRVTWDETADYEGFYQRIMENDTMFSKCSAFSFMSLHVTKDPSTTSIGSPLVHKSKIDVGDLTNWLVHERVPQNVAPFSKPKSGGKRSAFVVDWTAGEARILDTASAQEILTFLTTMAPRLQSLQVKMEEQQTKLVADVENVRVRLGVSKLKFNEHDTTFWDDPKRLSSPEYVNPDEVRQCVDSLLASAILYRWYFKGHQLRIVKPGKAYFINATTNEVEIPANFGEFSWMTRHLRAASLERVFNVCRTFWWVWFSLVLVVVGDVELL